MHNIVWHLKKIYVWYVSAPSYNSIVILSQADKELHNSLRLLLVYLTMVFFFRENGLQETRYHN